MHAEANSDESAVRPLGSSHPTPSRRGRTVAAAGASLACHVGILLAILAAGPKPPLLAAPPPINVDLVPAPTVAPPSPSPSAKPLSEIPPPPRTLVARKTKSPPRDDTTPADDATADPGPGLTDAQLAGAATAGSGGGGGACDMARRLQDALRKDPLAQAAVARFNGKAVMVWNGDWVWMPGEEGKGLAAVRQAMMWEIAFSPKACQGQRVHGLVVIAAAEGTRLAVGLNEWRWSDLLIPHPSAGGGPDE